MSGATLLFHDPSHAHEQIRDFTASRSRISHRRRHYPWDHARNAVAVIRFRSGALGILKGTVSMNPERRIHGVTLVGESGATVSFDCWQVKDAGRRVASGPWDVGSNDIWTIPDPAQQPVTKAQAMDFSSGGLPNFHAHQLRDVIGAIRDKRPPAVTGIDGRRVVAIIQGVYESGKSGRPVKLSD